MNEAGYTVGDTEGTGTDPKRVQGEGGGRGVESGGGQARGVPLGQRFLEDKRGLPGFPYAEAHVARQLGLNKNEARVLRQNGLTEGSEFSRDQKGRVWLSIQGVEAVVAKVSRNSEKAAQGEPGEQPDPVKNGLTDEAVKGLLDSFPAERIEPVRIVVVKANLKNRRMVLAMLDDGQERTPAEWRHLVSRVVTGKCVRVRVKGQDGLREGMVLEAVRVEGYEDLYDLVPGQLRRARANGGG